MADLKPPRFDAASHVMKGPIMTFNERFGPLILGEGRR